MESSSSVEVTSRRNITFEEISRNKLMSHRDYKPWRQMLDQYLAQEGLLHVVQTPPRPPPLGLRPQERHRNAYVDFRLDQERVTTLLLLIIPLHSFKRKKDMTPYDMLQELEKECDISARNDAAEAAAMERTREDIRNDPDLSHLVMRRRKNEEGPSNPK